MMVSGPEEHNKNILSHAKPSDRRNVTLGLVSVFYEYVANP